MNSLTAALLAIHVLSSVVWVGGMFYALVVLRPALGVLDAGPRLQLHMLTLKRFFLVVWHAMPLMLITGWGMIVAAGWPSAALCECHAGAGAGDGGYFPLHLFRSVPPSAPRHPAWSGIAEPYPAAGHRQSAPRRAGHSDRHLRGRHVRGYIRRPQPEFGAFHDQLQPVVVKTS
jgi:hypothetical protein